MKVAVGLRRVAAGKRTSGRRAAQIAAVQAGAAGKRTGRQRAVAGNRGASFKHALGPAASRHSIKKGQVCCLPRVIFFIVTVQTAGIPQGHLVFLPG